MRCEYEKRKRLTDSDRMPINGVHYNKRLGRIPKEYWLWWLRQDWCDNWPDLVEYANHCVDDDE